MKKWLVIILAVGLFVAGTYAETVESQNVVGFFKINVETNWNLLAIPMQKLTVATGQFEVPHSSVNLTDNDPPWADGEYKWGINTVGVGTDFKETGESVFYVEITGPDSSAYIGRHLYISNCLASGTLEILGGVPIDIENGLSNETYKIVPAIRIRDVFGEPFSPKLAAAVGTEAIADKIYFHDGTDYGTYIFYNDNVGPPGWHDQWRIGGDNADNYVIDRDAGFFLKRIANTVTSIVVTGEVSPNPQAVLLSAGKWNLVGGLSVVDNGITNTTLQANLAAAVGTDAIADKIYPWDYSVNDYGVSVFYNNNVGPPGWHDQWRQGGNPASNFVFNASSGYFIRTYDTASQWVRESPLK